MYAPMGFQRVELEGHIDMSSVKKCQKPGCKLVLVCSKFRESIVMIPFE